MRILQLSSRLTIDQSGFIRVVWLIRVVEVVQYVSLVWVEADGWTLTLLSIWTEKYWIVQNSNVTLYCIREQRSRSGLCDSHKELACSLVRRRLATAQAELTQTNYLMFINTNTQSNKFPNVYQMRTFIKCFVIDKQGLFGMCNVGTGLERLDQITQFFFLWRTGTYRVTYLLYNLF